MSKFSPKIEIINHFDNLINRIDIDIDYQLEKCNVEQVLNQLVLSSENNRNNFTKKYHDLEVKLFNTSNSSKYHNQTLDICPESTKVIDYLKQVRMKSIEELRNAQDETLEYYKLNSSRFKSELSNKKNKDELRSLLFADKFYFQINLNQRYWTFNVFTFVTDFYMSQSDIESLE